MDVDTNDVNSNRRLLSKVREEDKASKARALEKRQTLYEESDETMAKIERDPNHVMALKKQYDDQRKKLGIVTEDERLGI